MPRRTQARQLLDRNPRLLTLAIQCRNKQLKNFCTKSRARQVDVRKRSEHHRLQNWPRRKLCRALCEKKPSHPSVGIEGLAGTMRITFCNSRQRTSGDHIFDSRVGDLVNPSKFGMPYQSDYSPGIIKTRLWQNPK